MVCKVFFAKKLSEKGRKSGVKLTGMHFDATVLRNCHKNTQKRRTFLVCAGNAPATNPAGKSGGFPARIYSRQSSLARCTTGARSSSSQSSARVNSS